MAKRISTAVSRASSRVLRQTAELMRNFPTPSQAALKNGALRGFLDVPDVAVQLPEPPQGAAGFSGGDRVANNELSIY